MSFLVSEGMLVMLELIVKKRLKFSSKTGIVETLEGIEVYRFKDWEIRFQGLSDYDKDIFIKCDWDNIKDMKRS